MPGATAGVTNGQEIEVNGLHITCYHTPCHTKGSTCYYIKPAAGEEEDMQHTVENVNGYQVSKQVNRSYYTGDTIFNAGAGFFFEGTP